MERKIDYEKRYFRLFNKVGEALLAMEKFNYGEAASILLTAQAETEEIYADNKDENKSASAPEPFILNGFLSIN